jgi:hypothetical protein
VLLGAVLAFAQAVAAFATPVALSCPTPVTLSPPATAACAGAAPADGASIAGPVLQVESGDTVCVALGPSPTQWVRVVLADAGADAAKGALMAAAFSRDVICVTAGAADGGGVRGVCVADGVSVGVLAGAPDAKAEAASWR